MPIQNYSGRRVLRTLTHRRLTLMPEWKYIERSLLLTIRTPRIRICMVPSYEIDDPISKCLSLSIAVPVGSPAMEMLSAVLIWTARR